MKELPGAAYLAVRDFQQNLFDELSIDPARAPKGVSVWGDLVYAEKPLPEPGNRPFWQRNILEKPFIAEFKSIKEAADILRAIQRNWAHYPVAAFRRAELIKEKLPYINDKPRAFPYHIPRSPMGMWSLLDDHTLFGSAVTASPLPAGEIRFVEDHENPPSRAYLKMYEALAWAEYCSIPTGRYTAPDQTTNQASASAPEPTLAYAPPLPGPGSRIIDAGACPGGWTWVFNLLGSTVTAIDRSPLRDDLMARPNITFLKHDAFTLKPEDLGPQDWVCSDVICYPPRLLEWVEKWLDSGLCGNFICTIKMQGAADHDTTRAFARIPGSRIVHLGANKNELTWIRLTSAAE